MLKQIELSFEHATNSPPVFLVCGYNRPFPLRLDRGEGQGEVSNLPCSEGLASVYLKFKQLKGPATLHQQPTLNHRLFRNGFGLRANDPKPAGKWIERFTEWLADCGFLRYP